MIQLSEAVLNGHPDKFCDQLADTILHETLRKRPGAYGQVECSIWSNRIWVSGVIAANPAPEIDLLALAQKVGRAIGYREGTTNDPANFQIDDHLCRLAADPRDWTAQPNDQCITTGWAGYDARTRYLAPEHFLVHALREALVAACDGQKTKHQKRKDQWNDQGGALQGHGPDGKVLVRLREETGRWILEHVLVTLQHHENTTLLDLATQTAKVLGAAYENIRSRDSRWVAAWPDVELLINPHGTLVEAGSLADNGQTGRKLVMDYYGPRVPIGGGALSGKDLTHIDRAAAYAARKAAVECVAAGARECKVTLCYAPGVHEPLDVRFDIDGPGRPAHPSRFIHSNTVRWLQSFTDIAPLGTGIHFYDPSLPWNQPAPLNLPDADAS